MTLRVTSEVKKNVLKNKPLMVKLSPNVTNIRVFAKACEEGGADAISAINTLLGMAINIHTKKNLIYRMLQAVFQVLPSSL